MWFCGGAGKAPMQQRKRTSVKMAAASPDSCHYG